jgi:hypothetical protein
MSMMEKDQMLHLSEGVYASFGHFAFKFEEVRINIKEILVQIMENNGLSNINYAEMAFAGHTADPLRTIFLSFCAEYFKDDKVSQNIIYKINKKFIEAIELRNKLIHSFWAIGYGETPDDTIAVGVRPKISKNGLTYYDMNFFASDFRYFATQLELLDSFVYEIRKCIEEGRDLSSIDNIDDIDQIALVCS